MPFPDSVRERIQLFRDNYKDYTSPTYKEFRVRKEFVDQLFEGLGWDVSNKEGSAEAYKHVIHEDSIKIEGASKAPDYAFKIGLTRKFFVETKAPANSIKDDDAAAFQLRRYGWSAKLPLCILTNFRELAVYDCRSKPSRNDRASNARLLFITLEEYEKRWAEIEERFSYDAVRKGAFDRYAENAADRRGTVEVDQEFLIDIEHWRETLAKSFASRNQGISARDLNTAVQLTIDRIIFLRIAEARGIEQYGRLLSLANGTNIYQKLGKQFLQADERYNSGLFHFSKNDGPKQSLDTFTLSLKLDDKILKHILTRLYPPESPYEFSVLPSNILGQVYEQFLGKVIRLTGRSAKVEEKPEVKKAGGVFYTPTNIVRFIIEEAISPLVRDKTPAQLSGLDKRIKNGMPLRIVDPACGSGTFLIEAYQYLLDWYQAQYLKDESEKHSKGKSARLYRAAGGEFRLTIAERRRILLTHIFGVDLDFQAVEVTKLSLLLKVLEGENSDAIAAQMNMFNTRALPDLADNIKAGNSLVSDDVMPTFLEMMLETEEVGRNNPFNWNSAFPFLESSGGFDAVVGNPPYIDSEWMTKHWPHERRYCTEKYVYAKGNWDIFCVFIGRSIDLLKDSGNLSFIVPNKLMTASYAKHTRKYLIDKGFIRKIRDYSAIKVFPVAVYPIVFSFNKNGAASDTVYEKMEYENGIATEKSALKTNIRAKFVNGEEWQFDDGDDPLLLGENITTLGIVAKINDAATVGQAYELIELLDNKSRPKKGDLKLVNSGTLDPYVSLWGIRPTRYIKHAFTHPILSLSQFKNYHPERIRQGQMKKLLVANMTKRLEVFYDEKGEYLAGKSVSVIETEYDNYVLLAILNSKFMSEYFEKRFHGKKLAGGYLQVTPSSLKLLPVPIKVSKSVAENLKAASIRLALEKMRALEEESEQSRVAAYKICTALEQKIETEVRKLYQLNK